MADAPVTCTRASQKDHLQHRRPDLLVAADQNGAVHSFCHLLQQLEYRVETVFETDDALARILREENRHHLLVTGAIDGDRSLAVPAAELVTRLREVGYRGCIHLRSGFVAPAELGVYQKAGVGYILSQPVGHPSFLDDVQALTAAAPADAPCLSIVQVDV